MTGPPPTEPVGAAALSIITPLPAAHQLSPLYDRHHPTTEAQRSILTALTAAIDWPERSWTDLVDRLLALGRTDIPLSRLAEGHIDVLQQNADADAMLPRRSRADPVRTGVLVAIPAHDEAETIAGCLRSVIDSLQTAIRTETIRRARIAVAAHRCSDDTARIARHVLADAGVEHLIRVVDRHSGVGLVRTELILQALGAGRQMDPHHTWIFSTDADTVVPQDWVVNTLSIATAAGADLVAGLADLAAWAAPTAARAAYADLIASGITRDGHSHIYAADLAVRADRFLQVGGFPDRLHGEEHGLLDAVQRSGGLTVQTTASRVSTSAWAPGRAEHGSAHCSAASPTNRMHRLHPNKAS